MIKNVMQGKLEYYKNNTWHGTFDNVGLLLYILNTLFHLTLRCVSSMSKNVELILSGFHPTQPWLVGCKIRTAGSEEWQHVPTPELASKWKQGRLTKTPEKNRLYKDDKSASLHVM